MEINVCIHHYCGRVARYKCVAKYAMNWHIKYVQSLIASYYIQITLHTDKDSIA